MSQHVGHLEHHNSCLLHLSHTLYESHPFETVPSIAVSHSLTSWMRKHGHMIEGVVEDICTRTELQDGKHALSQNIGCTW
jgi:hypothetical protein